MEFQLGIFLGILTLVTWGFSDFISKNVLNNKVSVWPVFILSEFFSALIAFAAALFTGNLESIFIPEYFFVIGVSIVNFIGMYFFYKSLSLRELSISIPLIYSSVIITVILSMIFYSEILKPSQYLAIVIIVTGIILLVSDSVSAKQFNLSQWFPFASMIAFGFYYFFLKIPAEIFNPFTIAWSVSFFTAIIFLPKLFESKNKLKNFKKTIVYIFFIGLLNVVGFLAFLKAISVSPVSLITPIKSASPIFSILLAFVFLKEKLNKKELLSVLLMLAGIIIISI